VESSRVSPFLFGVTHTDLVGPLAQFQATLPELQDVTRLINSINHLSDQSIDKTRLDEAIQMWWPRLEERLQELSRQDALRTPRPQREVRDIVEEILEISRGLQRRNVMDRIIWRTSSHSGAEGGVQVGFVDDTVAVRNTEDPEGTVIMTSRRAWNEFLDRIRADESEPEAK
jgi:Domain of unknown function (DUF397)